MKAKIVLSSLVLVAASVGACGSNPEVGNEGQSSGSRGDGDGDGDGESSGDTSIHLGDGDGDGNGNGDSTSGSSRGDGDGDANAGGALNVPDWEFPDDISFDYTPIKTGGDSCGSVEGTPESVSRPIDIIFVIDNSGSMSGEIQDVENNVKENFADIIEESGIDYRVIMISRYGSSTGPGFGHTNYGVCVPAPLGGHDCENPTSKLPANGSRFFHYSADIESLDALCVILESYDEADEFDNQNTTNDGAIYNNWISAAPNGWQEWIRPEAFKTFVVISDDDVNCNTNSFSSRVSDQNFPNLGLNDGPNSDMAGQTVADTFDTALLSLSAEQFGTTSARNYTFHSIVGLNENDPVDHPWQPGDDVVGSNCSPGSEGRGTGYQQLSRLTGGLRYPICVVDGGGDFNPIFDEIAQGVIETAALPCEYDFPDVDGLINPDNIKVNYTPNGGGDAVEFNRVTNADACTSGDDFYFDENDDPTKLFLCGSACTTVQNDGGDLKLDFGCLGS